MLFRSVMLILMFILAMLGRGLGGDDRRCGGRVGLRFLDRRFACRRRMVVFVMTMGIVIMTVRFMVMRFVVVMAGIGVMFAVVMFAVLGVRLAGVRTFLLVEMRLALIGLGRLRRILAGVLDHVALDAVTMAAAARVAVARAATVAVGGAVLALFLGLAMGAFISLDQRLTVGDRDLVIVGMDFAEGQEAVAVAAIFDEGCLQRRLYARNLGEVDIAAQLFALGGLEIKFFDTIAADHDDPGLFRVGGIDQHLVGHFATLDGGGRGAWRAQIARPGDATVHLIRG